MRSHMCTRETLMIEKRFYDQPLKSFREEFSFLIIDEYIYIRIYGW